MDRQLTDITVAGSRSILDDSCRLRSTPARPIIMTTVFPHVLRGVTYSQARSINKNVDLVSQFHRSKATKRTATTLTQGMPMRHVGEPATSRTELSSVFSPAVLEMYPPWCPAAGPAVVKSVDAYNYVRCYTEVTNGRALTRNSIAAPKMTIEYCAGTCTEFTTLRVEYGDEKYGGNSLNEDSVKVHEGD